MEESLIPREGACMENTVKLSLKNITKEFKTRRQNILAVEGISFSIKEKEFVSLVGPSGCGKSTIIRMIDGIISPSSGSIVVDNSEYTVRPSKEILKKFGFIFQNHNLLPWMTVQQNLELPLKILGCQTEADYERVDELLAMVSLTKYKDAYISDLSAGMQQRLGVIRAMVYNPEILLMDEPYGALDETTRVQMDLETLRIWKETGKTIIFITHNVSESVLLSDRIMVMSTNPGRIVETLDVDLPRPRTMDMMLDDRFIEIRNRVVQLIGQLDLSKIK